MSLNTLGKFIDSKGNIVCEFFSAPNALRKDSDIISQCLYTLSEKIIKGNPDVPRGGGFLGGEFGYGADFENDVFMMHHYCWCEEEGECPWCTGCGFFQNNNSCVACSGSYPHGRLRTQAIEKDGCDYHFGRGIFARFAPWTHDSKSGYYDPPNFWYKPTNFRVTWYKWIGRDMAINRTITGKEWGEIFKECIRSTEGWREDMKRRGKK